MLRLTARFTTARLFALLLLAVVMLFAALPVAANPQLRLVSVTGHASLPAVRPDFPVPSDPGQVFYLQRSMNANTVVYAARFEGGALSPSQPIFAYWRRYNTTGETRALNLTERLFAYGVSARATRQAGQYRVRFAGLSQVDLVLQATAPGQAALFAHSDGRTLRLDYGFLELDETGLVPRVTALRLFGTDTRTGLYQEHLYAVSGGEVGG